MTAMSAVQVLERRDRQALARRRQRAEAFVLRERKRNSRLALAGFAGLAVALILGIHATLAPTAVGAQLMPVDAASIEFARTRVAHVLLTTVESAYCRELRFSNDSGRFSDGGRYRCFIDNEPTFQPNGPAPVNEAAVRADRISSVFRAR
jgi:hypothetical protein